MRIFDISEAEHFCTALPAHVPGVGQSLAALHNTLGRTLLVEGTTYFDAHRVSLLNSVERWILFGVSDYRRALDMFVASNAPWAHVTLYYSAFFAANAILGMFGAWVHIERLVDVENGAPTSQTFRVHKKFRSPSGYRGSHQIFWDFYYEACNSIGPLAPPELQAATVPVKSDRGWLIRARNEVNYDTFAAFDSSVEFNASFNPKKLRSVTGALGMQLEVTEGMLKLALHFANSFGVNSFALDALGSTGKRGSVLRSLVTKTPPGLATQSELQEMFRV
jgi:hypothetical protein